MPKLTQDEKTLTEATLAANNTISGTESHRKTVTQILKNSLFRYLHLRHFCFTMHLTFKQSARFTNYQFLPCQC